MVKVNSNLNETKNIIASQTISYGQNSINTSLRAQIAPGSLEAKLNLAYMKSNDEVNYGYEYIYQLYIRNNTNEEQRDVQVNLNINDLMEKKYIVYSSNSPREEVETEGLSFTIPSIQANDIAYVEYGIEIKKYTESLDKAEAVCIVKDLNNNVYRSNKISNTIIGPVIDIELKSSVKPSTETNIINLGDEMIYTIKLKNRGKIDENDLKIMDRFSKYLDLQEVTLNGEECEYVEMKEYDEEKNYDTLKINSSLKTGEEATIVIKGKVNEEFDLTQDYEVINQADLYTDILLASTEKSSYYLKAKSNTNNGDNDSNDNDNGNNNDNSQNGQQEDTNKENDEDTVDNTEKMDESNTISGLAWLDENFNGKREEEENLLEGIKARLFDIEENIEINNTTTNSSGEYYFNNVNKGKYVVIFEYNTEKYNLTTYQGEGVNSSNNSDVKIVTLNLNDENQKVSATNVLTINGSSIKNIDIGLVEAKKFDLSLSKTISKVSVTNLEGNKSINYSDTNLAKVEIKGKYLKDSVVVVEYKIKVTNKGELAGYAKKIVDNKPSDLKFNSKLNPDWYQSSNMLYNTSLSNEIIEPGETKELTLILTKTMTNSNTGLTSNKAEVLEYFNSQGIVDEGSSQDDDISQADLIISVSTGIAVKFAFTIIFTIITIAGVVYIIIKKVLERT